MWFRVNDIILISGFCGFSLIWYLSVAFMDNVIIDFFFVNKLGFFAWREYFSLNTKTDFFEPVMKRNR